MNHQVSVDPTRVAAYIRWSTDEQSEGTTLEVQTEACRHFILAQGWQWRPQLVFVDDGYSGGSMDRPGLSRLRQAVEAGQVACVVVFKLDRLSRNVVDTVKLVLEEWEGLSYIKSTREPIDTTSPSGKMFFYMLASYAEWERSVIKERTMSGKIKRAQQGRNPGFVAPFGYRSGNQPGGWVVDEREAAVVRRVFSEYLSGKGINQVATLLQRETLRPRRARRWHITTILQMLRNVAYIGVLEYGRSGSLAKRGSKTRVQFAEPRYARVEGAIPPIISGSEFGEVQRILAQRGRPSGRRALNPTYLLTGIARCGCGASLWGFAQLTRDKRYYRCSAAFGAPAEPCKASVIPADKLDNIVVEDLKSRLGPAARERLTDKVRQELAAELSQAKAILRELEIAKAGFVSRRERLDKDYDVGDLTAKTYERRLEAIEQEALDLERRLEATRDRIERLQSADVSTLEYQRLTEKMDAWESLDAAERKHLLKCLLVEVKAFRQCSRGGRGPQSLDVELTVRQLVAPRQENEQLCAVASAVCAD